MIDYKGRRWKKVSKYDNSLIMQPEEGGDERILYNLERQEVIVEYAI